MRYEKWKTWLNVYPIIFAFSNGTEMFFHGCQPMKHKNLTRFIFRLVFNDELIDTWIKYDDVFTVFSDGTWGK